MKDIASEYAKASPGAFRLETEVLRQIETILSENKVSLSNPVEHRVKTLSSVLEKAERKNVSAGESLKSLPDLVGFRIVLLFRRDLVIVNNLIVATFQILESEDTSARLNEGQFGYQSYHYVCKIPPAWSRLPSFKGISDIQFEIQVRTASQNIWAAASHKLQYKQESGVPLPLRRSIHRVAALLETVDLEFERVLSERERYENESRKQPDDDLNIVTLVPPDFSSKNRYDRARKGYYYNHTGLTRIAVEREFGTEFWENKKEKKAK